MKVKEFKTGKVRQAYEENGPSDGEALLLVHGWPDSPRTWDKILPQLHRAGYRTIAPYLRGYGPSQFLSKWLAGPPRSGQPVAFAQDMIDLADGQGWERFHFVGHDWGAHTGHILAALFARRLKSLATISVPFEPGKALPPEFPQARAFWYQWLLCSDPGEEKFRADPVAFGRAQWDVWSPPGWYTRQEFEAAAESWQGRDFEEVVLHRYRSRWGHAKADPEYSGLQKRFEATEKLSVSTLLIHGASDNCELKQTTDGAKKHFSGYYKRVLLKGVGHFPQREAPNKVAKHLLAHLSKNKQG